MKSELTLEEALGMAEHAVVTRLMPCLPPQFAIIVIAREQFDGPRSLNFRGFFSRAEAWDAVEAVSSFKRPTPTPDQDVIDNQRFPGDVDCGETPAHEGIAHDEKKENTLEQSQ